MTDETDDNVPVRDDKGRFIKGVSGNPAGKPKGTRNYIVALRENTELALRDYMASPANQKKALAAMDALFEQAAAGEVAAIKLLLDKILPNVRAGADDGETEKQKPVAIQIINQTSDKATNPVQVTTIDQDGNEVD